MSAKVLSFPCKIEPLSVKEYIKVVDRLRAAHDYLRDQHIDMLPDTTFKAQCANWDARLMVLNALKKVMDAEEATCETHEQWKLYILDREPKMVDYADLDRQDRLWRQQHPYLLMSYWALLLSFSGLAIYGIYRAAFWACLWWWR